MRGKETYCYNIKTTWHAISRMYSDQGIDHDISTSTGFLLLNIHPTDGTPATKIGPKMGLEPRSLTRVLKGLEGKAWIYKAKDPEDKRLSKVYLTELGLKKRDIASKAVYDFNEKLYSKISKKKMDTFMEVMDIINNELEIIKESNQ
jgi:DNA-binding MarR family transcriptional regulator